MGIIIDINIGEQKKDRNRSMWPTRLPSGDVTPTGFIFEFYDGGTTKKWYLAVKDGEWKGSWSSGTNYSVADIVSYGGNIYGCTKANYSSISNQPGSGGEAEDYWKLIAENGTWKSDWAVDTSYAENNVVIYDDDIYACIEAHTSKKVTGEEDTPDKWDDLPCLCTDEKSGGTLEYSSKIDSPGYGSDTYFFGGVNTFAGYAGFSGEDVLWCDDTSPRNFRGENHEYAFKINDASIEDNDIADEYSSDNPYRWMRRPITLVDEDSTDEHRYQIGDGTYNLRLKAITTGDKTKLDINRDLVQDEDDEGHAKIKLRDDGYNASRYLWKNAPARSFHLEVKEVGTESRGYYFTSDYESGNGTFRIDALRPEGIFFAGFDTSDTDNYKVTESCSYSADAYTSPILRAKTGSDQIVKVYLFPRRWVYHFRTSSWTDPYDDWIDIEVINDGGDGNFYCSGAPYEVELGPEDKWPIKGPCTQLIYYESGDLKCVDYAEGHCEEDGCWPENGQIHVRYKWYAVQCDGDFEISCSSGTYDYYCSSDSYSCGPPSIYPKCESTFCDDKNYNTEGLEGEGQIRYEAFDIKHYVCFWWDRPYNRFFARRRSNTGTPGYACVEPDTDGIRGCNASGYSGAYSVIFEPDRDDARTWEDAVGEDGDNLLAGFSGFQTIGYPSFSGDYDDISGKDMDNSDPALFFGLSGSGNIVKRIRGRFCTDPNYGELIPPTYKPKLFDTNWDQICRKVIKSDFWDNYYDSFDYDNECCANEETESEPSYETITSVFVSNHKIGVGISPHRAGDLLAVVRVGSKVFYVWRKTDEDSLVVDEDERFRVIGKSYGTDTDWEGSHLGFDNQHHVCWWDPLHAYEMGVANAGRHPWMFYVDQFSGDNTRKLTHYSVTPYIETNEDMSSSLCSGGAWRYCFLGHGSHINIETDDGDVELERPIFVMGRGL